MSELRMPEDLDSLPVLMVVRDSPAWEAMMRLCLSGPAQPGQLVPISRGELESLRKDVLAVQIKKTGT